MIGINGHIGYTAKICEVCKVSTPHRIIQGEGCLVKLCFVCERKAIKRDDKENHYYVAES